MPRLLHPRHGPHRPASATPARRPASLRRTTTHDVLRPEGLLGPVVLDARGRDLCTEADGSAVVLDAVELTIGAGDVDDHAVGSITSVPSDERLGGLLGTAYDRGFRRRLAEVVGAPGPLVHQLLDDAPAVLLLGEGVLHLAWGDGAEGLPVPQLMDAAGVCAGWAEGATILEESARVGLPPLPTGPTAPELDRADDSLAWHATADLPLHSNRRRRRIDVWDGDGVTNVESHFRDSHVHGDGEEVVLHEYTVRVALDPGTTVIRSCHVEVGVLPWQECPGAAASAGRVVGLRLDGLSTWVRTTLTGTSTCSHLNDTLRALEGLAPLVQLARS